MISFECDNCGRTVNAGDDKVGLKGKCRWCGGDIEVPSAAEAAAVAEAAKIAAEAVEIPDDALAPGPEHFFPDKPWVGISPAQEEEQESRVLPMPFDMLLYPTSKAGLLTVAIVVGTSAVLRLFLMGLGFLGFFLIVPVYLLSFLLWCYAFWYVSECISDSAEGGIRAPETIGNAPDLPEIMMRWISIIVTSICCFAPMSIYSAKTGRVDGVYCALYGVGVFVFPMALLSVVRQDSLGGLNPIVLVGAMARTLVPYCVLVCFYGGIGFFINCMAFASSLPLLVEHLAYAAIMYMSLVAGHVLGAFGHRYEERLW